MKFLYSIQIERLGCLIERSYYRLANGSVITLESVISERSW